LKRDDDIRLIVLAWELSQTEQFFDGTFVSTIYKAEVSQVSLPLGSFLGQDVTVESMSSLDFT
jgi:hypothetical protein